MLLIRKTFAELLGIRLADKIKGYNVNDYYKLFISSISWSRDQIEGYQLERLKVISKGLNLQDCSKGSSSGSTGHPVIYYHDKNGSSANKASEIFSKYLGG